MITEHTVPLTPAHVQSAALVAARAFANDPMFTYIFPEAAQRLVGLRRFMLAGLRYGMLYGAVHTTTDGAGTALWLTPEQPEITPGRMVHSGMALLPITLGLPAFRRFLTFTSYGERVHKALMSEPHWYLLNLAVDPTRQRRGIGSQLLAPTLERADHQQQPCYLETNSPGNILFYAKHGFKVVHAGQIPNNGPLFWSLLRKPRIDVA